MRKYIPENGFAGTQANSNPTTAVNTVAVEDVKVGSFVELQEEGIKPLSEAGKVAGMVTKHDATVGDTIPKGSNVTLAKKGSFYVKATTAVTANEKVFVVNTGEAVGSVRADDTEAEEVNATFQTTTNEATTVAVDLNL